MTVGSPLLSYIDVRLSGFLPRGLTIGEARARGPRFIREGFLFLVRDGLADSVFQGKAKHILVEDLTTAKSDDVMVEHRNMNVGHFFSNAQPARGQAVLADTPYNSWSQ